MNENECCDVRLGNIDGGRFIKKKNRVRGVS